MLVIAQNMVTSFTMFYVIPDIVESRWTLIELVTMLYVITNTLLKVSLNTNKTGHRPVLLVINDTFNNVLVITYNMVTSFISV
jgi:hypothetical protein